MLGFRIDPLSSDELRAGHAKSPVLRFSTASLHGEQDLFEMFVAGEEIFLPAARSAGRKLVLDQPVIVVGSLHEYKTLAKDRAGSLSLRCVTMLLTGRMSEERLNQLTRSLENHALLCVVAGWQAYRLSAPAKAGPFSPGLLAGPIRTTSFLMILFLASQDLLCLNSTIFMIASHGRETRFTATTTESRLRLWSLNDDAVFKCVRRSSTKYVFFTRTFFTILGRLFIPVAKFRHREASNRGRCAPHPASAVMDGALLVPVERRRLPAQRLLSPPTKSVARRVR